MELLYEVPAVGDDVFFDRSYVFTDLGDYAGTNFLYLKVSNDDKFIPVEDVAYEITTSGPVRVYIDIWAGQAYFDETSIGEWLGNWTNITDRWAPMVYSDRGGDPKGPGWVFARDFDEGVIELYGKWDSRGSGKGIYLTFIEPCTGNDMSTTTSASTTGLSTSTTGLTTSTTGLSTSTTGLSTSSIVTTTMADATTPSLQTPSGDWCQCFSSLNGTGCFQAGAATRLMMYAEGWSQPSSARAWIPKVVKAALLAFYGYGAPGQLEHAQDGSVPMEVHMLDIGCGVACGEDPSGEVVRAIRADGDGPFSSCAPPSEPSFLLAIGEDEVNFAEVANVAVEAANELEGGAVPHLIAGRWGDMPFSATEYSIAFAKSSWYQDQVSLLRLLEAAGVQHALFWFCEDEIDFLQVLPVLEFALSLGVVLEEIEFSTAFSDAGPNFDFEQMEATAHIVAVTGEHCTPVEVVEVLSGIPVLSSSLLAGAYDEDTVQALPPVGFLALGADPNEGESLISDLEDWWAALDSTLFEPALQPYLGNGLFPSDMGERQHAKYVFDSTYLSLWAARQSEVGGGTSLQSLETIVLDGLTGKSSFNWKYQRIEKRRLIQQPTSCTSGSSSV